MYFFLFQYRKQYQTLGKVISWQNQEQMHAGFFFLFFFPLYLACIQRQTDTKSKSHLVGCVRYIFIRGGFHWGVGRKRQPRLNAMLKTLPLPALKASPPWSQSHVGLMRDGDNAKMGDNSRNGHGGWRSETLPWRGAGTTASPLHSANLQEWWRHNTKLTEKSRHARNIKHW